MSKHHPKVITWQTPSGDRLDICRSCGFRLSEAGRWPKNRYGEEYCSVHHGAHKGTCQIGETGDR